VGAVSVAILAVAIYVSKTRKSDLDDDLKKANQMASV
jgi:hypothetical protein